MTQLEIIETLQAGKIVTKNTNGRLRHFIIEQDFNSGLKQLYEINRDKNSKAFGSRCESCFDNLFDRSYFPTYSIYEEKKPTLVWVPFNLPRTNFIIGYESGSYVIDIHGNHDRGYSLFIYSGGCGNSRFLGHFNTLDQAKEAAHKHYEEND